MKYYIQMEKCDFLSRRNIFYLENIERIPLRYIWGTMPAQQKDDGKFDECS